MMGELMNRGYGPYFAMVPLSRERLDNLHFFNAHVLNNLLLRDMEDFVFQDLWRRILIATK